MVCVVGPGGEVSVRVDVLDDFLKVFRDHFSGGHVGSASGSAGVEPGCQEFLGGGVVVVADDFSYQSELSFEDLVFDRVDVVEGFSDLLVFDVVFSHICPFYFEDAAYGFVVE